jgi:hypothetical protein
MKSTSSAGWVRDTTVWRIPRRDALKCPDAGVTVAAFEAN